MTTRPDFSALFTASPYPYLLIDTGFVIIGANPAYLRATGRTPDDIVGKNIFDAFPANPSDPDSTNIDEVRTSIELAISTRQPHTSALLRYAIPQISAGTRCSTTASGARGAGGLRVRDRGRSVFWVLSGAQGVAVVAGGLSAV